MTKALFVHDHPFFEKQELFYSQGGLPSYVWIRYLQSFDEITVFGRQLKGIKSIERLVMSSRKNVTFELSRYYFRPKDLFFNFYSINKEISKSLGKVDAAIIRLPSVLGLLAVYNCISMKKPYILEVVGDASDATSTFSPILRTYGKILNILIKKVVKGAPYVVYVTKEYLQKKFPTDGTTVSISNVRVEDLDDQVLAKRIKKIETMPEGKFVIGLIGSMNVRYKGHTELLHAVSEIGNRYGIHDISIRFVGQGDYKWIENLAQELGLSNVEIVGQLAGDEIPHFIDSIDVYVHPSRAEGLPRVIMEAFSRGCPVLASDAGGIFEILDPNDIHKAGDVNQLCFDLLRVYRNRNEMMKMAIESFKRVASFQEKKLNEKRKVIFDKFLLDNRIDVKAQSYISE